MNTYQLREKLKTIKSQIADGSANPEKCINAIIASLIVLTDEIDRVDRKINAANEANKPREKNPFINNPLDGFFK